MINVVGVTFKENGKVYYFLPNNLNLKKNLTVLVETDRGLQFGKIATNIISIKKVDNDIPYNSVIRITNKADYIKHKKNLKEASDALKKCRELAKKNKLNIKVIDAEFNFDRTKLQFNFTADQRIDFRKLARDLAAIYKTRIELRQIGVRDKASEISGIGQCGRELCCSCFLKELDTVSINMAKNQNLALNPTKINGVCGRLLCCLKYEDENYTDCRKCFPKIGSTVEIEQGKGIVKEINVISGTYKILIPDIGIIEKKVVRDGSCK